MPVLVSTDGLRADLRPLVGLAVRLRELGAEVRAAEEPRRPAESTAVQSDTVAAVAQGHDVLVATGVTPAGVWR